MDLKKLRAGYTEKAFNPLARLNCSEVNHINRGNSDATKRSQIGKKLSAKPVSESDSDGLEFEEDSKQSKMVPSKLTFSQKFGVKSMAVDLKRKKVE